MMVDIEEIFGKDEYGIKKTFIPPEEVDLDFPTPVFPNTPMRGS